MKVALIGFGVENQASFRHFKRLGAEVTICDINDSMQVPDGVDTQLGEEYLQNLDKFDVIVRTVGMHPSIILAANPSVKPKITTAINLFFEACKTPIIGITGTKGKGTTSTLILKILEAAGKKALLAGNIGDPALDILEAAHAQDYIVLELSSFQLYDATYSPHIGVCLMVVPEHLNWHHDFEDYKYAKANLFRHQNSDDFAVYNALNDSSQEIVSVSAAKKIAYSVPASGNVPRPKIDAYVDGEAIYFDDQLICSTKDVKLPGRHNLENACAAIAATWGLINGDVGAIKSVLSTFTGLPFRLELVRELNGVKYYNDSFSTTPETAIAALKAFDQPKIIIVGGSDKGVPFNELAEAITTSNVKHMLAIGQMGPAIADLARNKGFTSITTENLDSMSAVISKAHQLSSPGDIVLLSTGCASFGMFRDYKDRGKQFNQAVQALA